METELPLDIFENFTVLLSSAQTPNLRFHKETTVVNPREHIQSSNKYTFFTLPVLSDPTVDRPRFIFSFKADFDCKYENKK